MAAAPSHHEIRDFITQLLMMWERTPSTEPAVFNDERIAAHAVWNAHRLQAVRLHCSKLGWIQYPNAGSKDYTLTEVGIRSGREARRR